MLPGPQGIDILDPGHLEGIFPCWANCIVSGSVVWAVGMAGPLLGASVGLDIVGWAHAEVKGRVDRSFVWGDKPRLP